MAESTRKLVELNHPITAGMTTYPGMPGPAITPYLTWEDSKSHYAEGTEFSIGRIEMIANTGTYLDTPSHRFRDGYDLAGLDLAKIADVPIALIDRTGGPRAIGPDAFAGAALGGCAVLVRTDWSRHWGTDAYLDTAAAPYLTADAARHLVEAGATLVGIDSVNIDDASGVGPRPAHTALLGAGIPILEHLTGLHELPAAGARLHAVPPRIEGFGTFPTRAYAVVES